MAPIEFMKGIVQDTVSLVGEVDKVARIHSSGTTSKEA